MYAQHADMANCFDVLDLREESGNLSSEKPVFVDIPVGGGTGGQCMEAKNRFFDIPGKIVLQDLPAVIAEAKVVQGIETQAYDCFTPQPIRGISSHSIRGGTILTASDRCKVLLPPRRSARLRRRQMRRDSWEHSQCYDG